MGATFHRFGYSRQPIRGGLQPLPISKRVNLIAGSGIPVAPTKFGLGVERDYIDHTPCASPIWCYLECDRCLCLRNILASSQWRVSERLELGWHYLSSKESNDLPTVL